MFDDQPIQNSVSGQVPSNLPMGEPEDILRELDKEDDGPTGLAENVPGAVPVQSVNSALSAGILRPKQPTVVEPIKPPTTVPVAASTMPPPAQYHVMPEENVENQGASVKQEIYEVKGPMLSKVFLVLILILVIGGVAWAGYWAYGKYFANQTVDNGINDSTTTEQNIDNNIVPTDGTLDNSATVLTTDNSSSASSNSTTFTNGVSADQQVLFGESVDTDGDGLDDATEVKLNTDPKNWDTDGDALSDGDEVNVWHTDPLKADTDGDSYADGSEVKNGYNPLGPGKLFEPPTSTPTSSVAK